ncbi:hypothetical protein ACRE9E_25755, partial [Klebsiella pneumoniae]
IHLNLMIFTKIIRGFISTLDRFDAQGMLIIASKKITKSLVEHIDVLKRKGIWADFWDRDYIEKLLDDNPDVALKYKDIVSFMD